MADAKTTPGEEGKKLNADGTPAITPAKDEENEPKVGDIVDDADKGKLKEPKGDDDKPTVGLDKFLGEKKARKAAETELANLKAQLEDGDISADDADKAIDALAEEYEGKVDKDFLKKLGKALKQKPSSSKSSEKKEPDDEVSTRLSKLEQRERQEAIDKAFDKHFTRAMERMPEFKDVVNPSVIKSLSLDPKNKDKTFSQIIEDTYGKAIPAGRRTIEKTTPGGGKEPETVDFDRAVKDTAYYKEVMANPALKKQYNDGLEKRIKL